MRVIPKKETKRTIKQWTTRTGTGIDMQIQNRRNLSGVQTIQR